MKFKTYKGEILQDCIVSYKIDGVRAHKLEDGSIVSRSGKPLYNVQTQNLVSEIYLGSWEETVSAVRTIKGTPVSSEHIYSLDPIDERFIIGIFPKLDSTTIDNMLFEALQKGYEGLVICSGSKLYKVKPIETFDVTITDLLEGTGQFRGMLGAFITPMGKVGTGFTPAERAEFFNPNLIGSLIEVECMSLTPANKFRHPRFVRFRWDKEGSVDNFDRIFRNKSKTDKPLERPKYCYKACHQPDCACIPNGEG